MPPENIRKQKSYSFLMFSGGIEVEHWLKMGCFLKTSNAYNSRNEWGYVYDV